MIRTFSGNTLGALLMMGSMAAYTFNDALVKLLGADLPLFQIITLRGILASILIYALARYLGRLRFDLTPRDWGLVGLRSLAEIGITYCFLTALIVMPIANITAMLQALPLTVTLGAALFFGEAVGWRRALAILLGFCGMLLIVRPGADGFTQGALYGLLAVLLITCRDLMTRRMSTQVPSLTVTLIGSITITLFGVVGSMTQEWAPVNHQNALVLVGASLLIVVGYALSVMVMRVGEIAFVSPFRYTGLLWAMGLGWVMFDEWPDPVTQAGAFLIVATGVFTLYRERLQSRA